jgi:hypothetical protein
LCSGIFALTVSTSLASCSGPAAVVGEGHIEAGLGAAVWREATAASPVAALPRLDPVDDPGYAYQRLVALVHDWPRLYPGVESRYISSHDRSGGNDDGFTGGDSLLYETDGGEAVIVDVAGPGILDTLWFTSRGAAENPLDLGRLQFFFDDERVARFEADADAIFGGGGVAPLRPPLVVDRTVSTGGNVSWLPMPYAHRLRIVAERRPGFYIAQLDRVPADWAVVSWQPDDDVSELERAFRQVAAGEIDDGALTEVPLDYRLDGPGTIERLRFEPSGPTSTESLSTARIRIWWDNAEVPAVDAPLGMFFGSGLGEAPIEAVAFSMRDGVFTQRMQMPFWESAHLRVEGIDGRLWLRVGPPLEIAGSAGYLHAVFHDENPTTPGRDFEFLDFEGSGRLVGTVLTVWPETPTTKRWWEGDLRTYVDGRRTPSLHGTGHEDDHLGGWSNTLFSGPFSQPMHGVPRVEILDTEVQINANVTFYRLWPGITFLSGIRHSVEHGHANRVPAHYAGLTFLYGRPEPCLEPVVHLVMADPDSRAAHRVDDERLDAAPPYTLTSTFEGRGVDGSLTAEVVEHAGALRFDVPRAEEGSGEVGRPEGLLLRRLYDQAAGRQRAVVRVQGRDVAVWYSAESNATHRWAERDLFIPRSLLGEAGVVEVEIAPDPAGPPWNAAEYRAFWVREAGPS